MQGLPVSRNAPSLAQLTALACASRAPLIRTGHVWRAPQMRKRFSNRTIQRLIREGLMTPTTRPAAPPFVRLTKAGRDFAGAHGAAAARDLATIFAIAA